MTTETKVPDHHDVEWIAKFFSRKIHELAITPDYYITGFGKGRGEWQIIEMEDCTKTVQEFTPHCRMPYKYRQNLFYKAERANQGIMATQLMCNYFAPRAQSNCLFFRQQSVKKVEIQWLVVEGHQSPIVDEWEKTLLDRKLSFPVVGLVLADDSKAYIDICGTQVDVWSYDADRNGVPYYARTTPFEVKGLYAPELNRNVTVLSIEDPIEVKGQSNYEAYLEMLENEFCEEVRFFNEYLYKTINDELKKKNKNKKKNNKNRRKNKNKQTEGDDSEVEAEEKQDEDKPE